MSNTRPLQEANTESNRLTREAIRTGLIMLMHNNKYDRITVTDIIKRAGVSRSGFYRNYQSKEEVLDEVAGEIKVLVLGECPDITMDLHERYLFVFNAVAQGWGSVELLLGADIPPEMTLRLESYFEDALNGHNAKTTYYYSALCSSLLTIVDSWYKGGMKESAEEMADLMAEIFGGKLKEL